MCSYTKIPENILSKNITRKYLFFLCRLLTIMI